MVVAWSDRFDQREETEWGCRVDDNRLPTTEGF